MKVHLITATGTFNYCDEIPALFIKGENFEKKILRTRRKKII